MALTGTNTGGEFDTGAGALGGAATTLACDGGICGGRATNQGGPAGGCTEYAVAFAGRDSGAGSDRPTVVGEAFGSGGTAVRVDPRAGRDFWVSVLTTTATGGLARGGAAVEALSRAAVGAGAAREIVPEEVRSLAGAR